MRRLVLWVAMLAAGGISVVSALATVGWLLGSQALEAGALHRGDPLVVPNASRGFARPASARTEISQPAAGLAYTVFTDSRGLRANGPGQVAPSQVDVLVIGGSFSAGHGFANPQTFTEHLGRDLDAEVANAALSSYGTVASLATLRDLSDLRPRIVVYGLIADHLRRNLDPCAPSFQAPCLPVPHVTFSDDQQPQLVKPNEEISRRAFAFSESLRQQREDPTLLGTIQLGLEALGHRLTRRLSGGPPAYSEALRERALLFTLRKLARRTERAGAQLVVLNLPHMDAPHAGSRGAWLREALPGLIVVDFAEYVRTHLDIHSLPSMILSADDRHPNAYAHELIARALSETIEDQGLLGNRAELPVTTTGSTP
ncbi:hypothetical protein MK489_17820 [Myxococcota bacterium]|nr:hypothetical protein [Myxococcota bacterium]